LIIVTVRHGISRSYTVQQSCKQIRPQITRISLIEKNYLALQVFFYQALAEASPRG